MATPYDSIERGQLEPRMQSGGRWFYWIAALSIITSFISLVGSNWVFLAGLGITQIFDGLARGLAPRFGEGTKIIALVFDFVAAGLFALIGYFATKRHSWAFLTGMSLYALDMLLLLVFGAWLPLAFHAYALYSIFGGYRACARLVELDKAASVASIPQPPPASTFTS